MNPYENLPQKSFWKLAVGTVKPLEVDQLWSPKFNLTESDKFVTYGSCFAQHIGRALKARGFNWTDVEPAPYGLSDANKKVFNYGVFSSRTGNIYTSTLLRQWTRWACGLDLVPDEVWEQDGRFYDPFRPAIEPNGFASVEEMRDSQRFAIASFKESIEICDYFVFTMGLTESWFHSVHGYEYPMCPGTIAGEFVEGSHIFLNQDYAQVNKALIETIELMKSMNPNIKFIVTVSPVPLTATKSGNHVLTATTYSKSVLRAVAGHLSSTIECVDYFPSYEIITAPVFGGQFYEENRRGVTTKGVSFVMDSFFKCLSGIKPQQPRIQTTEVKELTKPDQQSAQDLLNCEEAVLDAFAQGARQ